MGLNSGFKGLIDITPSNPSDNFVYHQEWQSTIQRSAHTVRFMCFTWISVKKAAIISLYRRSVYWAVRHERRLFLDVKVKCLAVLLDFLLIWYSMEFVPHSDEQLYRFSTSFFHGCAFVSAGWIPNISFIRRLVLKVRTMSKKASYSTEELVLAATWAVSYDSDTAYAARFRKEFKKEPPDQKTITAWKKDLLEKGMPNLQIDVTATQLPHNFRLLP